MSKVKLITKYQKRWCKLKGRYERSREQRFNAKTEEEKADFRAIQDDCAVEMRAIEMVLTDLQELG
jgi:hypothetical protein